MRRSIKFLIAGCFACALTLAGCGGAPTPADDGAADSTEAQEEAAQSEPQVEDAEEPEEPEGPSEAGLQAYFEAISTNEPDRIREALPLTVPGSNANAYVVCYAALQQSFIEANLEDPPLYLETLRPTLQMWLNQAKLK